ncbi:MAG: FAD-dependent oxidoreductase, partial [Deinococcus sp.]|nr:FAD-dependent oxidoreductase [Deinococcus sp.]
FIQTTYTAYIHRKDAQPNHLRLRESIADCQGGVAELLTKTVNQGALDQEVSAEDREKLLDALKTWGVLDRDGRYTTSLDTSGVRGYRIDPADRLQEGTPSEVQPLGWLLEHDFWEDAYTGTHYSYQGTIFQPVGGMDRIAAGFERQVGRLFTYGAEVNSLTVTDREVSVTYTDRASGQQQQVVADYCICTIPLSILSQLQVQVNRELEGAIRQVAYAPSFKAGIQAGRFWERDERIYGGVTYTDLPNQLISYPSYGMNQLEDGVLLAGYQFGAWATKYSAMEPEERLRLIREDVTRIHPQLPQHYRTGVTVGWHRVPWTLGCYGMYTDEGRKGPYEVLSRRHGRLMLAGEHISYWNGWMEGALLSGISALEAIHEAAQAEGGTGAGSGD